MTGGWRRPHEVGLVWDEGVLYLARLPAGPIVRLDGTAAVIWEVATTSDRNRLVPDVAEAFGVSPDAVRGEVEAFVADLVRRGLLDAG